jgi:hypothetical protein
MPSGEKVLLPIMKLKMLVCWVVILLVCFVSTTGGQKAAPLLDQIVRSLPQMDSGWIHTGTDVFQGNDGSTQADIRWMNGDIELGATVMVYPTVKQARQAFRPSEKDDVQEAFRIDGIGDEAFLWPPKVPVGGAYNIRFRKAHVEVWMGAACEAELKRLALAIAAAIERSNRGP